MKSTKAAQIIMKPLWPGAATPTAGVVSPAGMVALPSLSFGPVFSAAVGSLLARAASSPARRCSIVGVGGGGGVLAASAAGAALAAGAPSAADVQ